MPDDLSRIARVESKLEEHDRRLFEHREITNGLITKLDTHMTNTTIRDIQLEKGLDQVTNAVTDLSDHIKTTNDTLTSINTTVSSNNITIIEWKVIWKTLSKLAVIVSVLVGGIWTVTTYFIPHRPVQIEKAKAEQVETGATKNGR